MVRKTLFLAMSLLLGAAASVTAESQAKRASLGGVVKEIGTGKPVTGARVDLTPDNGDGGGGVALFGRRSGTINAVTDENGEYTIRDLAPGRYTVTVSALLYYRPHRDAGVRSVTLNAEQELRGVELFLGPTGVISGRVVDEAGEPLRHIQIELLRNDYGNCGEFSEPRLCGSRIWNVYRMTGNAATDDRGEYRIFNLEPGTYRIRETDSYISQDHQSFYPGVSDPLDAGSVRLEAGQERSGIDIVLKRSPEFSVKFKLTGAGAKDFGQPIIFFRRSGSLEESQHRTPKRLADGSLGVEHLPPGSYELFAWAPSADSEHTSAV